jgi:hypothetical protein
MPSGELEFHTVFGEELEIVRQRRVNVTTNVDKSLTHRLVRFVEDERFRRNGRYEPDRTDGPWPPDCWPLQDDGPFEGDGARDRPATMQLVGLALSGGGIRSAATCLGAMQALDAKGVMQAVDYLSSVSGGGYAAACLNANIAGARDGKAVAAAPTRAAIASAQAAPTVTPHRFPDPKPGWIFPFPHMVGIRETVLFRYLRANAQYLIPRGQVLEYGFAPVLVLRGVFMNLWAMLPLVLLLSAVTLFLLVCPRLRSAAGAAELFGSTAALLAILWALFFINSRPIRTKLETGHHPAAWTSLWAMGLAVAIAAFLLVDISRGIIAVAIVLIVTAWEWRRQIKFTKLHAAQANTKWRPDPGTIETDAAAEHSINVAAGLARESYRQAQALALLVSAGILFLMLQPVAAAWVGEALEKGDITLQGLSALAVAITGSAWLGKLEKLPEAVRKALFLLAAALVGPVLLWGGSLLIAAAIALHGGVWSHGDLGFHIAFDRTDRIATFFKECVPLIPLRFAAIATAAAAGLALVIVAALLWWLNRRLYNANDVSPHSHYRDKLANTFLFSVDFSNRETVASQSERKLSAMDVATAPFPLINAALNFADRDAYRGRGRDCSFFTFSPRHIGGTEVDFMRTRDLEAVHPRFKLSSAVAISAAAAAANAGRNTNPALRFLLSLVNVRLGYWLPNPRIVCTPRYAPVGGKRPRFPEPGAWHLLSEMVGALGTKSAFINLSDGGHLENLGIYELIRRRCRVIIAIDAEQDGAFSFVSLGDLVRFARIDRAVNIEIDVSDIRPDKDGISKCHAAFGRIDYGRGAYGWLIYIKSSLTGREDESVRKYRAVQKAFPHHSTGDQFFDEEQFEAYRALGTHMVIETFARWR